MSERSIVGHQTFYVFYECDFSNIGWQGRFCTQDELFGQNRYGDEELKYTGDPMRMQCIGLLVFFLVLLQSVSATAVEYNQKDLILQNAGRVFIYLDQNKNAISGMVREYHKNGVLKSEGAVENGLREGVKKEYGPTGRLLSATTFKRGLRNGLRVEYHKNGQKKAEMTYVDHTLSGPKHEFDEQGRLLSQASEHSGQNTVTALRSGQTGQKSFTNSVGMEFVLIPAGVFVMGCEQGGKMCEKLESPPHQVRITQPFYLGRYEVTQAQWQAVMGENPSKVKGSTNPVESVSWNAAQEFIRKLREREGGKPYRLPTEAEWEYAARAGASTRYHFGDSPNQLDRYAWYDGLNTSLIVQSHPVGEKQPNRWGLYDMHGNVWEWVQDWAGLYPNESLSDPEGPSSGRYRVMRGGSWLDKAEHCRLTYRIVHKPEFQTKVFGLRIAFTPEQ